MASTHFIDYSPDTPIVAAWLNDVNDFVYGGGGGVQYTSMASMRAGLPAITRGLVQLLGYYAPGDGGGGAYARVATTPTGYTDNGGTIIIDGTGNVWALLSPGNRWSVRQFGAKGDWNGTTGTDDSTAINNLLAWAGNYGGTVVFPDSNSYKINSPLVCQTTVPLATALPNVGIYFSDMRTVSIEAPGDATLVAGASMAQMLNFTFYTPLSNIAPMFSSVTGLKFNGNNLAGGGVILNFCTHAHIERCAFEGMTPNGFGIANNGYGVAQYIYNTLWCPVGIQLQFGGDHEIIHNDIYALPAPATGSWGIEFQQFTGNTRVRNNTFTSDVSSVGDIGIYFHGNIVGQTGEIRDVVIDANEFSGYTQCIYGVAGSSNIYNNIITNNHVTQFGAKTNMQFINLTGAINCLIDGNIIGEQSYGTFTAGILLQLANCSKMTVTRNKFWNLQNTPIAMTNCVQCVVDDNEFYDYGKSGVSVAGIALFSTCISNTFRNNLFNQSSGTYGQFGIQETTGCNSNFARGNRFIGVSNPLPVIGAQTEFFREEWASSIANVTGLFNVGDKVYNTAPTPQRAIHEWTCITTGSPGVWIANGYGFGTTGQRPTLSSNDTGYAYADTTVPSKLLWNGSAWI